MKKIVLLITVLMLSVAAVGGKEAVDKVATGEPYADLIEANIGRENYDSLENSVCVTIISTRYTDCKYIIMGILPNSKVTSYMAQGDAVGVSCCCGFNVVEIYDRKVLHDAFDGLFSMLMLPERQQRVVRADYPYWIFLMLKDGRIILLDTNKGEETTDDRSSETGR